MIRNLTAAVAALFLTTSAFGQFWTEDFGTELIPCASQGQTVTAFVGDNGDWTLEEPTPNSGAANNWFVSSQEGGFDPGNCAQTCGDNPGITDRSLHIGGTFSTTDPGAEYFDFAGPPTGTDRRAVSPVIDCSGFSNIELSFDFIHVGNGEGDDYCTLDYFDGATWQELQVIPQTPVDGSCLPGSPIWDNFTIVLPASANNNANVQIGFRWRNNASNNAASKSVAIDDIALQEAPIEDPPTASFSVDQSTICVEECVQFSDESTGQEITSWEWTFQGGTPSSFSGQNPPQVCYDTPGTYEVSLTAENEAGSDTETISDYITVESCGPIVNFTPSEAAICEYECISFTNNTTGENIQSYTWTFDGADTPSSTEEEPSDICWSTPGDYDITLEVVDDNGTASETFTLTVNNCITGPDVDFSASQTQICPGSCVDFFDQSSTTGTISSWEWVFSGAETTSSTEQNPTNICYEDPGTYTVSLTATDEEGETEVIQNGFITVETCEGAPIAQFSASDTTICTGDCVAFENQTLGDVESTLWSFPGASNITGSESYNPEPVCYNEPGVYDVSLVVSNSDGSDGLVETNLIEVESCINPPVPRIGVDQDTVCAGDCVSFTDESLGLGIGNWEWFFPGANTSTSVNQDPVNICYTIPGSYNVSLSISGTGGDADSTFTDVVTVVADASCRPQIDTVQFTDLLCEGTCTSFEAEVADADSVEWTFPGATPETSELLDPGQVCWNDTTGEFIVTLEAYNASGVTTYNDTVTVQQAPFLDAGQDRIINSGATVTLTANTNGVDGEFEWQPFEQVSNFQSREVNTTPLESTTYIVSFNLPGGCVVTDTVNVFVNFVANVGVPSAFSPNGDGNNDELKVYGQGIAQMDFRVYNRFGEQIFQTTDQSDGWDGTYRTSKLNTGVYVYALEVLYVDGRFETYSGDVTLVR